jgi:membrane associated rhomboid family serine protease
MAVTVVMVVIFYAGGVVEGTEGTNYEEPVITETFIIWAYILLALAIGLTLIFSLINMISNPKGAKKSLIGILGAAAVLFLAYILADDTVLNLPHYTGSDNVPSTLKMVDTGLFTAYIFAGLAVVSIIYVEIAKAFK